MLLLPGNIVHETFDILHFVLLQRHRWQASQMTLVELQCYTQQVVKQVKILQLGYTEVLTF